MELSDAIRANTRNMTASKEPPSRSHALCTALAASVALAAGAVAAAPLKEIVAERAKVGTLTCMSEVQKSASEPVIRGISCIYEPLGEDGKHAYSGSIIHNNKSDSGLQLGSGEVLVWNVLVPKGKAADINVLGKYYGVAQNDPAWPGVGPKTLLNGDSGIFLEPAIDEGTIPGPAIAIDIIELELKPARG